MTDDRARVIDPSASFEPLGYDAPVTILLNRPEPPGHQVVAIYTRPMRLVADSDVEELFANLQRMAREVGSSQVVVTTQPNAKKMVYTAFFLRPTP